MNIKYMNELLKRPLNAQSFAVKTIFCKLFALSKVTNVLTVYMSKEK